MGTLYYLQYLQYFQRQQGRGIISACTHIWWLRLGLIITVILAGAELGRAADCPYQHSGGILAEGAFRDTLRPGQLELVDGYLVYSPQWQPYAERGQSEPPAVILNVAIFKYSDDGFKYRPLYGGALPEQLPPHQDRIINVRHPGMDTLSIDADKPLPPQSGDLLAYFQLIISQSSSAPGFQVSLAPSTDPSIEERVDVDLIVAMVSYHLDRGQREHGMMAMGRLDRLAVEERCDMWADKQLAAQWLVAYSHD